MPASKEYTYPKKIGCGVRSVGHILGITIFLELLTAITFRTDHHNHNMKGTTAYLVTALLTVNIVLKGNIHFMTCYNLTQIRSKICKLILLSKHYLWFEYIVAIAKSLHLTNCPNGYYIMNCKSCHKHIGFVWLHKFIRREQTIPSFEVQVKL